ncbi:hypothetical protein COU18_00835 [Candidatus Kaiserbacteria bacterium CG10_big_fil_rev_8_21_14_0_10_51_14]|uniref:UDP-N-acetylmuramoyl-tripeptide--D-alanyl-D-alanine ligase n=1 Tax=Candidatus Kaiserbacteria bacterium CG10_big_fil_rev_8_21_14_0_10_51_14 TaxID=1974610 RepID=A0A2H0UBZ0_9BACT|nr:MAG: hypothetical protein COU18_00835 [Candidatus Kaiserbacteria bacterium CG10_big_fil_rev_8_21_14_0_10_51_14]
MTRWLSRRHPRYIRSIVYMLQASEYSIRDFFRWHERVEDFRHVEKRKRLDFTLKATLLYVSGWLATFFALAAAVLVFLNVGTPWNYVLSALIVLEIPLIVLLGVLVVLTALRFIQVPIEWFAMEQARRRLTVHKGIKIAIAGSFGKTSTREILRAVLSEGKKVAAPSGSHNTPLAIAAFVRSLKGDEDVLIFELGEYYPGDVRKLARTIRPDWGIITGVNEAHLEKFKSLQVTTDTIFELAEFVDPTQLYINGENELARNRRKHGNVLYSREGASTWQVSGLTSDLTGTRFTLSNDVSTFNVKSRLLGLHMAGPLVAAADIGLRLGLTVAEFERGIGKTKPFAHRLEPRQWEDGVTFLDDSYNGNPDGVRAVIEFLASLSGRRFYTTPGLVETGARIKEVHEAIGTELAKAGIEKVVLIKNSVTPHIEAGLKNTACKGEILWYDDMPSALSALRASSLPGDIILVQNDWPDQYA